MNKKRECPLYEREKSVEMAKKWCKDFESINKNLKEKGFNLNIAFKEEPTSSDIIFENLEENIPLNTKKAPTFEILSD